MKNDRAINILHVVEGLPPNGGGLAELVPLLAQAEAACGATVRIAIRADQDEALSSTALAAQQRGVELIRFRSSWPSFVYFSVSMLMGLRQYVRQTDVVHVHGNWTFPVWWACWCAVREKKLLVMSPQGSFDPVRLAHSAWKKRLAACFDRWCLRHAAVLHATAECERSWLESFGGVVLKEKTVVIPNGTDFVEVQRVISLEGPCQLLYLGRLHPLKGLDLLLPAIQSLPKEWTLTVAGPDEQGTLAHLKKQAMVLGVSDRVVFRGPVYGADKWRLLSQADCLVLPTRSENFGIIVAEALACGVPVVCTKGAPWQGLAEHRCGWWCDVSVEGLTAALVAMAGVSEVERTAMGQRGKAWVYSDLQWSSIGERMLRVYETARRLS